MKLDGEKIERDTVLHWFSITAEEDIEKAMEKYPETAARLIEKYKSQIELIKMGKGVTHGT